MTSVFYELFVCTKVTVHPICRDNIHLWSLWLKIIAWDQNTKVDPKSELDFYLFLITRFPL